MRSLTLQLPAPVAGRLPVLDEIKGFAILLVVLYHVGGVLVWNNYLHGDLGVDLFLSVELRRWLARLPFLSSR